MANFTKSIESLRRRSRQARRAYLAIGTLLLIMVLYAFTLVVYRYTSSSNPFNNWPEAVTSLSSKAKPQGWFYKTGSPQDVLFKDRIEQVLTNALGRDSYSLATWLHSTNPPAGNDAITTDYDPVKLKKDLEPLLNAYERMSAVQVPRVDNAGTANNSYFQPIISTLALSVGAVAFVVLLLQIALTFMRYYARLAELYEAQADALEAAGDDPELAYQFIEKFSPLAVDFGKVPVTIYEKAFDAVIDIAKSRK